MLLRAKNTQPLRLYYVRTLILYTCTTYEKQPLSLGYIRHQTHYSGWSSLCWGGSAQREAEWDNPSPVSPHDICKGLQTSCATAVLLQLSPIYTIETLFCFVFFFFSTKLSLKPGMLVHSYYPSVWEAGAAEPLRVQGQCGLHSKYPASQGYRARPCLRREKKSHPRW